MKTGRPKRSLLFASSLFVCLITVTTVFADQLQYTYDDLNRLIAAETLPYGKKIIYQHDDVGNIAQKAVIDTYQDTVTAGANGSISPGTTTVDSGSSQTFTITPLAGFKIANVTVDGTSVGAVSSYTLSNITAGHSISATFTALATILWRNEATARSTLWYMDGATWTGQFADLTSVPAPWQIVGRGDFNKDGKIDIVWRNPSSGLTTVWYMDGAQWLGGYMDLTPTVDDPNWALVGVADFNNDGNPDLLWRNAAAGRSTIWYMNNGAWSGQFEEQSNVQAPWQIAAVRDFNNDGNPDLLWRNPATGRNTVWFMNGGVWASNADLPSETDPNWQIVGAADYNYDNKPDILWRNTSTGANRIWYLDGTNYVGTADIPAVTDQNWQIAGH